jgi:hypothetical protein
VTRSRRSERTANGEPPGRPPWFRAERYAHLFKATSENQDEHRARQAWLHALNRCWALENWSTGQWRHAARVAGHRFPPRGGAPPLWAPGNDILPPPVETLAAGAKDPYAGRFGPILCLRLSLTAPDAVILAGVRAELRKSRQEHGLAVRRRGRRSLNSEFTRQHFSDWWNARVVQVAELDWWNRRQATPFSAADLARWIFGPDARDGRETRKMKDARVTLRRAIDSRDELAAQLALPSSE